MRELGNEAVLRQGCAQREQERTDKRAEHKRKEREKAFESLISLPSEQQETRLGELANDSTRTLPPFATISQHLWACKAGLHQQIHGMSNYARSGRDLEAASEDQR